MHIELITIGDELLLGFTVDTNAAYLGRELSALGIGIVRRETVGDDAEQIAAAVREALARTGAVITTGGLGPTSDDRTRDAVAVVFGRALQRDESVAEGLRAWWARRGLPGELPASNLAQAMVPDGATVLENRHGTAPGLWIEDAERRWVAVLPGPPREMRGLYADALRPRLKALAAAAGAGVIRSRTLRTTGISESALADSLDGLDAGVLGGSLAFLPSLDGVDLRVTVRGLAAAESDAVLERAAAALRARAGQWIYGEGDEDLATVVLRRCRERGWRVAVAESCTGGLLGARLTAPAGASDVFEGGVLAYHNRVKQALLGVTDGDLEAHGAVSEPVVRQMASGVRARLGTQVGVAITGIAGPSGGSAEKPVGTVWLALDVEGEVRARRIHAVGPRDEIRARAAQVALDLLRRAAERR